MATAARRPLIAGNWKMTLNHLEAIALVQKIAFTLPERYLDAVEVAVIPPFTDIRSVQTLIEGDKLSMVYGAQDLSPHDSGAYTGEISGGMLHKLGCTYAVIGHSERREYHDETDDLVQAKVAAAFRHDLVPILCVGEGLDVRDADNHVEHVTGQLIAALRGVPAEQAARIVIAYEPVWAIGTGRHRDSRRTRRRCARRCANCWPGSTGRTLRTACGSSTAARSSRRTSPTSWPSRTSTAPWSAGPAWTAPSSPSWWPTRWASFRPDRIQAEVLPVAPISHRPPVDWRPE